MSRSSYTDSGSGWGMICWRGAVNSAIKGQRGQEFLIGLAKLMDEMPEKKLISHRLIENGEMCTLGVACNALKIDVDRQNIYGLDNAELSEKLNIAEAMVREIEFMNDEGYWTIENPEQRWKRMRKWVDENIVK